MPVDPVFENPLDGSAVRPESYRVVETIVTRNDEEIRLLKGEHVDIPRGACHRVRNPGKTDMAFMGVQRGDYFGEDDIERAEDDYGRVA